MNNPFDREVWNRLERALSPDNNFAQSYAALALQQFMQQLGAGRLGAASDNGRTIPAVGGAAFIGSGYKVRPVGTGAMQVQLDAGLGLYNDNLPTASIGGIAGVNDESVIHPLQLTTIETIAVPVADPALPRIDIVEVTLDRYLTDPTVRDIFNPTSGAFSPSAVNKTLSYCQNGRSTSNAGGSINLKKGTPNATPTAPAVDSGYVKIAEVDVAAATTAITANNIRDLRLPAYPGGFLPFSFRLTVPRIPGATGAILSRVAVPPGMLVGAIIPTAAFAGPTHGADVSVFLIAGGLQNLPVVNVSLAAQNFSGSAGTLEALIPANRDPVTTFVPGPTAFQSMTPTLQVGNTQPCVQLDMIARIVQGGVTAPQVVYDVTGYFPL